MICKEYLDWISDTKTQSDFSIKEISATMLPGDRRVISCERVGFIEMFKEKNGDLMLIFENNVKRHFIDVKSEFVNKKIN